MAYVEVGSYIGEGSRQFIPTGFPPALLLIQNRSPSTLLAGTPIGSFTFSETIFNSGYNWAIELSSGGFYVDSTGISAEIRPNESLATYNYLAISLNSTILSIGSYETSGHEQRISVGFPPDLVIVRSMESLDQGAWATRLMSGSVGLSSESLVQHAIKYLTNDGFVLGNSPSVQRIGYSYCWIAMRAPLVSMFSYTGNGVDNRNLDGISPVKPLLSIARSIVGMDETLLRFASSPDDFSATVRDTAIPTTNLIQSSRPTGVQVGDSSLINGSGKVYHLAMIVPPQQAPNVFVDGVTARWFFPVVVDEQAPFNATANPNWSWSDLVYMLDEHVLDVWEGRGQVQDDRVVPPGGDVRSIAGGEVYILR